MNFNFLDSSFSFEQFIEARRNPELNPKVSAYEALLPFKDDSDIYISFTKVDKIGINPQSNYNTPLGIYTYPLKEVWKTYDFDKTRSPGKSVPFAGNSPFIWILRRKKGVRFIEDLYTSYTSREYDEDYKKLEKEYDMKDFSLKVLEVNARKTANHQSPSGIMWNLTRLIAEYLSGKNKKAPVQWNTILYRVLGYHGIADKSGKGIIHSSEPMQAVFLTTRGFEVEGQILNKDYVGVNSEKDLGKFISWLKNFYSKYKKVSVSFSPEVKEILLDIYLDSSLRFKYEFWGNKVFPIDDKYLERTIKIIISKYEAGNKINPNLANRLYDALPLIIKKFSEPYEINHPDVDELYFLIKEWDIYGNKFFNPLEKLRDLIIDNITILNYDMVFEAYIDTLTDWYYSKSQDSSDSLVELPEMTKEKSSIFIKWIVDEYKL